MNVGVIGCNGFVGKHLCLTMSKNKSINLKLFGKSDFNLTKLNLPYIKIDVSNKEETIKEIKDLDLIYYLASASIPVTSWENPKIEIEQNLLPFLNFLECVSLSNIKKVVFISSAGTVYGSSNEKLNEKTNKLPFSPYGINKLTMEYYLNYYQKKNNLNYDIFRVSNIYGENQDTSKGLGIINTFLENIIHKKNINIFGNGETIRNYIYIKDVISFLLTSLETELQQSNIYNLSSNDNLSINELLNIIDSIVKEEYKVQYMEQRNSDNPFISLDNSKIKSMFPSIQFTSIFGGIKSCYDFLKKEV
ncbi:NAD-dependent epimerase/dehydratase family protein [Flavobacterium jejuense]|uniref:NAD-dependent epimerase/dehydratase family protein n=1 Tax=Flavobacterium jejuense TaxID=1544455 RepID=A0ABX0IP75_9FLAO|nr:NAD-dependent epimerase/dehydratase family protein [Flavobacterium jejuense]NHN25607.1 NAD-dependent epimerase/dehydratase family protein [Flavobacterium jejuense]